MGSLLLVRRSRFGRRSLRSLRSLRSEREREREAVDDRRRRRNRGARSRRLERLREPSSAGFALLFVGFRCDCSTDDGGGTEGSLGPSVGRCTDDGRAGWGDLRGAVSGEGSGSSFDAGGGPFGGVGCLDGLGGGAASCLPPELLAASSAAGGGVGGCLGREGGGALRFGGS